MKPHCHGRSGKVSATDHLTCVSSELSVRGTPEGSSGGRKQCEWRQKKPAPRRDPAQREGSDSWMNATLRGVRPTGQLVRWARLCACRGRDCGSIPRGERIRSGIPRRSKRSWLRDSTKACGSRARVRAVPRPPLREKQVGARAGIGRGARPGGKPLLSKTMAAPPPQRETDKSNSAPTKCPHSVGRLNKGSPFCRGTAPRARFGKMPPFC